jgi:hypothetical protein
VSGLPTIEGTTWNSCSSFLCLNWVLNNLSVEETGQLSTAQHSLAESIMCLQL